MESQAPVTEIAVLREEPSWLVVAKPAGLHSVAQRDGAAASVEAWLRLHRPDLAGLEECGIAHRLDLETSGCLVVAKDEATRTRLRDAFSGRGGDVRKSYLALVAARGVRIGEHGAFTLSFTSRHKGSAKVTVRPKGEPVSIGRCRWMVRSTDGGRALLEVELIGPGRRHQIRAGLAFLGHPLAGDALYGGAAAQGLGLHAWRVVVDGISVECPVPAWATVEPSGA